MLKRFKPKVRDRCAIIIQARMSSSRFPEKMMSCLFSMPLIEYVYKRSQKSSADKILVATSNGVSDDTLYNYCKENNIFAMRGSLNNVLERYIQAGDLLDVDYIVRVGGDTPFVDIFLADMLLDVLIHEKLDYVSFNRKTCASGFYSEAVTLQALKKIAVLAKAKEDLEHVTKFIIDNREKFLTKFIDPDLNPESVKNIRLTVDFPEDIQRANAIVDALPDKFSFNSKDILNIIEKKVGYPWV